MVFDTDCVVCGGTVAFVLRHERDHALRFVGAWSAEGKRLASEHGFSAAEQNETFLVVEQGRALTRSEGALAVARHLRAPWRWLAALWLVSRPVRDTAYGFVARRRYRWFGRKVGLAVAPPDQRHRFVGVRGGSD